MIDKHSDDGSKVSQSLNSILGQDEKEIALAKESRRKKIQSIVSGHDINDEEDDQSKIKIARFLKRNNPFIMRTRSTTYSMLNKKKSKSNIKQSSSKRMDRKQPHQQSHQQPHQQPHQQQQKHQNNKQKRKPKNIVIIKDDKKHRKQINEINRRVHMILESNNIGERKRGQ